MRSDILIEEFPISINDLKDRYFANDKLSKDELLAIQNYNRFRLEYLNSATTEHEFDKRYLELQAKANLASFQDFL